MSTKIGLLLPGAALLVACSGPISPAETQKLSSDVTTQAAADPKLYPVGPFGYQVMDVIPNVAFVGRMDTAKKGPSSVIRLSDFYQDKNVKVLALLVAAEWCNPCNQEQGELVDAYTKYQADNAGVAFLEALTESTDGSPADLGTVDRWTTKKWTNVYTKKTGLQIAFPVVADPTFESVPLGVTAYPTRITVTTKDMVIQSIGQGYGKGAVEADIDSALAL